MRWRGLFLAVLLVGMLSACGGQRVDERSGTVVEAELGETLTAFVLRMEKEDVAILLTEETFVGSWVDVLTGEDFLAQAPLGTVVGVRCEEEETVYTARDGRQLTAYPARWITVQEARTGETAPLPDGEEAVCWEVGFGKLAYRLADGTELLRVLAPSGPDRVSVAGIEGFDDLSEAAKPRVLAFYEEQGLLYDTQATLERAYRDYRSQGADQAFDSYTLGQEIAPTASSGRVMYFLTSVMLPIDGTYMEERRLGAAFDRETGEVLPVWDLFTCSREEVLPTLLDRAGATDPVRRREMEAAFRPECLVFFPDHLEISFPQGAMPSEEYAYILGPDYDDLDDVLHDWAVPFGRE